jgi:hypothetical protein
MFCGAFLVLELLAGALGSNHESFLSLESVRINTAGVSVVVAGCDDAPYRARDFFRESRCALESECWRW